MSNRLARLLLAASALVALATASLAHDSWINRGAFKNTAGEWCCGDGDCALMEPGSVSLTSKGFVVNGLGVIKAPNATMIEHYREIVPQGEAQPSPDGAFWRCKRPDGTRRCFFAPPPST